MNKKLNDTFIEGIIKKFREQFVASDNRFLTGTETVGNAEKFIRQSFKSSLQEQRQSILEEIEKMKTDERKVYYFGKEPNCYGAETYQEKMLVNAVLEDIKQIIKK